MKNALNAMYLFVVLVAGYYFVQGYLTKRRMATIEKLSKVDLSCESDLDCTKLVYEVDFCGRGTKAVNASKKSPRYPELVLMAAKNTMPSMLDGMARRLFSDCLQLNDTAVITCSDNRCK